MDEQNGKMTDDNIVPPIWFRASGKLAAMLRKIAEQRGADGEEEVKRLVADIFEDFLNSQDIQRKGLDVHIVLLNEELKRALLFLGVRTGKGVRGLIMEGISNVIANYQDLL